MRITLLRHGEVQTEYIGKYNGHIDIPLSDNGKIQVTKVAHALKDEVFDAIYCSDLLRARQTLDAFKLLDVEPVFTKNLREKSWGIHEGKSFSEIESAELKYENFEQWISQLDGENLKDYQYNVNNYFINTILKTKAKNILIVTHGGFIRTLISKYEKISFEETFNIELRYASFVYFYENKISFT